MFVFGFNWGYSHISSVKVTDSAVLGPISVGWRTTFSPKFWNVGDQKKMSAWGELKSSATDICLEAYFVPCQKRLFKIKCNFEGSIAIIDLGQFVRQPTN